MFSNFLNKSFKAVYDTFTTATPRPQITFLKITSLLYKPFLELPSIFLIYNNTLHIYHFQNLPTVNFNLFCKYPLTTPTTSVHPVNHIPSFTSSLPVIAVLPTNQNVIHFITLNTKSLLKTIELPSSVLSISFNRKYFGIACSISKILIYDNNSLSEKEVLPIYAISKDKISKITSQAHFTRSMFGSNSNSNNNNNSSSNSSNIIFDMSDNFIMYYISHPNTTANAVEQQNPHENPLYNSSTSNITNESQYNTFEKIASNTYQSIKDFTSWGMQSIKNYNSLLQSKSISIPNTSTSTSIYVNNTNLKNATIINIFNISHAYTTHPNHNNSSNTTSSQIDVFALPYQIHIPSFKEGINSIKQIQNGKYIIIGNAHNQLFYIFELYPQTNKKYNINYIHNTSNRYKAIYSLFRGVTKCELNSLDISINNEYALITSKKGTHHVYHLPKRDNQINENVNGVSCCYTNDDLLNLKIVEANEIAKYKYDYYKNNNDKCNSLYDSMFINVDKITVEDNFNQNNSTKVMDIIKDKFSPYIHYGNYLVMVTDDKVNFVLIVNKKIIIPLNTFTINLDESEENIRRNYSIIMKQCSPIINNNNKANNSNSNVYDDIHLGQTCTDLSNFPVFQLNPLFTFNKAVDVVGETTSTASTMNNVLLHVQNVFQFEFTTDNGFNVYCSSNNNNNNSELHLLNELCNKQHDVYTKIKSKRKLSDNYNYNDSIHSKSIIINPNFQDNLNSSCELKETFYENKASILQSNITQAINSSIHDKLKQTNEVTIQNCQNYGQLYVLEYPFSEEAFEYLRKKFQRFKSNSSHKKPQHVKFPSPLPQEELTSRFLAYNPENCIHDIIVENIHYISCSAWINNPTKKKTYDVLYLEIFTLVFAKHKSIIFNDKHRDNTLQRIYMNLEAYSYFFTVAEKKKHFLGSELYKIIDFYEHFFSKANINNCTYSNFLSQLPVNNKVFNILQVIYRVINKQHLPKGLIDSLEFNYFTTINSPYDYCNNSSNSNNEVKSVYMMNKSILALHPHKLQEYLKVCIDINPQLLLFLRSASPFKSIWSVTKECRLDIGLVFDFVLKLQSWGLISIIYSIHEHSLFEVNPHWNCEIDKDDTHLITFNQFSFVEAFANSRPGTTILQFFTKCFEGKMDQKQFKKGLVNCLENEYLIQSTSYVLVKLPFKYKYDYECTILNEAKEFVNYDKNIEMLLEDKNVVGSERGKEDDEGYYYEDFVNDIKDNKEDYEMLKRITPFLYEGMNVEDISYFTNLNITTMLDMLNRYPYMFDIVVLPVK